VPRLFVFVGRCGMLRVACSSLKVVNAVRVVFQNHGLIRDRDYTLIDPTLGADAVVMLTTKPTERKLDQIRDEVRKIAGATIQP
jgi:hypothetical protein